MLPHQPVLVFSLDHDGCVGNSSTRTVGYIKGNPHLLNFIEQKIDALNPKEVIFMVGSNRQSLWHDLFNCLKNKNGSAFMAIKKIVDHVKLKRKNFNIELNPFIMEDLAVLKAHCNRSSMEENLGFYQKCNNQIVGLVKYIAMSISEKLNTIEEWPEYKKLGEKNRNKRPICFFDHTKITLLYAQLHNLASKERETGQMMHYFFLDDREDILGGLYSAYEKNLSLLPNNIALNLFKYNGETFPAQLNQPLLTAQQQPSGSGVRDYRMDLNNVYQQKSFVAQKNCEAMKPIYNSLLHQQKSLSFFNYSKRKSLSQVLKNYHASYAFYKKGGQCFQMNEGAAIIQWLKNGII